VVQDGTLSYFKSREEDEHCRAKIDITKSFVADHPSDENRYGALPSLAANAP
jgi:hypothetical protein